MRNPFSRIASWLKRDKATAKAVKTTKRGPAGVLTNRQIALFKKAASRKRRAMRDGNGVLTLHDIRCKSLMGMSLTAIRRFYGFRAAKYVASKA